MKNNYNKLIAFVLLALVSVSSQALLYKNEYFVWTYFNVAENNAGMGVLDAPGLKALSRTDTIHFWNSGEPNNSGGNEHCATQAKNGGWNDLNCNNARRLACFNGTNWQVTTGTVNLNNFSSTSRPSSCPAGYEFAAPTNLSQKQALDAAIPAGPDVWINAFDNTKGMGKEGVWVLNRGVTHLFGPNWAGSEPAADSNKNCASMNASGQWTAENCSETRALVCITQAYDAVEIINANTAYTSTEELHHLCRTQVSNPGEQWMLAAPRHKAENDSIASQIAAANFGPAWVNATGNRVGNTWQTNLDLTNWAAGEPNLNNGQCVVARSSDGKWQMAECDSSAKLVCTNGESWVLRVGTAEHQFSNQAIDACSRPNSPTDTNNPFSKYQLVTPITEFDRYQAYNALRSGSGNYWMNLKYLADTNSWLRNDQYKKPEFNGSSPQRAVWYHILQDGTNDRLYSGYWNDYYTGAQLNTDQALERNKGVTVYFADKEPNGSEANNRSSCIQLYASGANAGLWDDTRCDNNTKRVACFDGFEWAISPNATNLGANNQNPEDVSAGHAACAQVEKNGVKGNFVFATPRSFAQSQQLLTVARESGASDVWININSKKYKRTYVFNLGANVIAPFWNPEEPNNAGAGEDCAVQTASGKWNDLPCASVQPVACYSPYEGVNGTWQVTSANHAYSDTTALTKLCETTFGAQYKFYAPETLSQMNDLKAAMGSNPNAYINANDIEYEGTWIMNQGINNWAVGQQPYANDGKSCVSANATDAQWRTQNCAANLPVACYTGGSWKFTEGKVKLDNFANGQAACVTEYGQGHIFQAPRSLNVAEELQYAAKQAGVGGDFWINGNSLETHTAWKWNQISLKTPIWGDGQPAGGRNSSCALLNNNTQGAWEDARCDQSQNFAYMCRNGNQWQVSTQTGNLADFSTATAACNAIGSGWQFAAPATYNENVLAKNAMGSVSQAWVNATDSMKDGVWVLNAAPSLSYPNWANSLQPGNCAYQSDDGKLHAIDCGNSAENSWSCTNGYTWRVTTAKGKVGSFSDGHKACLSEFGPAFVFAAPLSKNDTIQLDFARLLTATENSINIDRVWLNMTTGGNAQLATGDGRKFRRNLPFTNWSGLLAGQEPSFDQCAYKGSTHNGVNNPWNIGSCTGVTAHYACTNGSQWKVATSKGKIENGVVQIVPTEKDYWSYERGNSMCKEQFGGAYYFSAPVTAAEELALDASIRNSKASVKRVWLNAYGVGSLSGVDNKWFVNRLHLGVWQKPEFRNYNNSDCAILHKDGSWTDVSCKNSPTKYAFACFNGQWSVKGNGNWEDGFATCDDSTAAMFAVPRTPDEMAALQAEMGTEPVWINLTDTAFESQWIANRLRFTWWATGEPSNIGNRDCARVRANSGEWYAGKCSIEAAPFACRTTSGNTVSWDITAAEGVWSDGFGACEREFPGSLFMAPEGYGVVSAKADQDVLYSTANAGNKDAWINLSDQDVEGSWRAHRAYADWGTKSLFDEGKDCAFLDRNSTGAGTWLADSCKYTASTAQARGYACTDGYQWAIVSETATTDMRWSGGFTECQTLGAGWRFAAPTNAFENTKLKLAMELHSTEQTQIWINAHDRFVEGEWQLNGPETNFAPTIDTSATALRVAESQSNIQLTATLADDEELGIASADWSLVSNIGAVSGEHFTDISLINHQLTTGPNGSGVVTAQYSTPVLLKEDRLLTFKVTATDIPPSTAAAATSESFIQVRVLGPLVAAWDFDNLSRTNLDRTGRGHDALSSSMPQVVVQNGKGVLKLDSTSQMIVPGKATDPENGLEYPADNYTIAFRMSVEEPADSSSPFRNILQKGATAGARQPLISLMSSSDKLHTSHSTNSSNVNADTASDVNTLQWINVIYVQNGTDIKVYVDGVEVAANNFNGLLPSQNNGDLYIGMGPAPSNPSFVGYIDDIQVYSRALTQTERNQALPQPPLGAVQFSEVGYEINEDAGSYDVILERTRGDNAELTVYVDFDPANSTATMGVPADMTSASNPADFAFTNEGLRVSGKGIPVTWAAGEKGPKSFNLTLDSADDGIREGTEVARFIVSDLNGAEAGVNKYFNLRLLDVTPNPYGNFSVSIDGLSSKQVPENAGVQEICFKRESGTTGAVTLNYQVLGNAIVNEDFTYDGGLAVTVPTGTVEFAAGDGTDKCIRLQPINNPVIGEDDKTYNVEITSLNPLDSAHDPLLTEQRFVSLVIYDWAPGEFSFTATSFDCKEPNDGSRVAESIKPTVEEMNCFVAVERVNTGNTVPAATLNVSAVKRNSSGIDYTFNSQLLWPVVDANNPKNPANEVQYIAFDITNNNSQDDDLVVDLTLQPTSAEIITMSAAELSIKDITEPSLIAISSPSNINEGQTINYTVTRSGNNQTIFDIDYAVSMNPVLPKDLSHYLDLGASSPLSGTFTYTKGTANAVRELTYVTKNTLENNPDFKLEVLLSNPQPRNPGPANEVVAIGDYAAAGTTNNQVTGITEVMNVTEVIAHNYSIEIKDNGAVGDNMTHRLSHDEGVVAQLGNYYASKKAQVPGHREFDIEFSLPRNLDIHSNAHYEWKLLNADGSVPVWSDGITNYNTQAHANAQIHTNRTGPLNYDPVNEFNLLTKVKLPFVLASKDFKLQLVITGNGPNGDGSKNFTKDFAFTVDPLFRRLENNDQGGCLRAGNDDGALPGCDESNAPTGEWTDIRWAWHETQKVLISKENLQCITLNQSSITSPARIPGRSACNPSSANQKADFSVNGEFRIDSTRVCADKNIIGNWRDGVRRNNDCSGDRSLWTWKD